MRLRNHTRTIVAILLALCTAIVVALYAQAPANTPAKPTDKPTEQPAPSENAEQAAELPALDAPTAEPADPVATPTQEAGPTEASEPADELATSNASADASRNAADAAAANTDTSFSDEELQRAVSAAIPRVEQSKVAPNAEYEAGVVLAMVRKGTTVEQFSQAVAEAGVISVEPNGTEAVTDDLMMARLTPNATIDDAIYELESTGIAQSAQPNYVYEIAEEPTPIDKSDEVEPAAEDNATLGKEQAASDTSNPSAADEPGLAIEANEAAASNEAATPNESSPAAETEALEEQTDAQPTLGAQSTSPTATRDALNDTYANKQWDLDSIDALDAWEFPPLKNATTTVGVGVVDNGFNDSHEDLADNVRSTYNATTRVENVPVLCPPGTPNDNHGSHVAGIVAATSNNNKGISGVGFNHLKLSLVSLTQESDPTGISTDDVVAGFEYLITHKDQYNIRVANMSIGGKVGSLPTDDAILNKIDEAYKKGIVTVASAGNQTGYAVPPYINYPSDYETVVSVMNLRNTNDNDPKSVDLSGTSNYNAPGETGKNISAPGANIYSTYPTGYGEMSGTSMAAPHVAGVVGLMYAVNPMLTTDQAKSLLYNSARDIGDPGWDAKFGHGEVNAFAAVRAAAAGSIAGPAYLAAGSDTTYTVTSDYAGWSFLSSNPNVLTIDNDGAATAVSAGIATVSASNGSSTLVQQVTVLGPITGKGFVAKDGSESLTITTPSECGDLSWSWSSSNESVATVANDGVVYGHGEGTATITATLVSSPNVTLSHTVAVYDTYQGDAYVPAGETVTLEPNVPAGAETPTISWSSANEQVATIASNGTVTAVRAGGAAVSCTIAYSGESVTNVWRVYVYGPIEGASCVGVGQSVQLAVAGINNVTPELQTGWTWALNAGSDGAVATVSETGTVTGRKPGKVTVTATRGSEQDQVSFSHTVEVTAMTLANATVTIPKQTYSGKELTPAPVVTLNGTTLVTGVDYDVVDQSIVNVSSYAVTIKGKGIYEGTTTGTFVVEPLKLKPPKALTGLVYNGLPQSGVPEGADYTLRGNYMGIDVDDYVAIADIKSSANTEDRINVCWENNSTTCRIEWSIKERPASEVSIEGLGSYVYNGSAHTPKPKVTWNGKDLESDEDYTVSYANNVNAGTATVTIKCENGNFKGTKTATFSIEPASLSDASVTGLSDQLYSGKFFTPKPTVTLAGKTLHEDTDYTLSYKNNLDVGLATVLITGTGNYVGTKAETFKIVSPPCSVAYQSHVQNVGWQDWVRNGVASGTSGRSLRLEGVSLKLEEQPCAGSIEYRTHVQNVGWEDAWSRDGGVSGTSGQSLRVEALQIRLAGDVAEHYDVWYRVHAQNIGWMGWAKNGEQAGTEAYGYRLEALEVLVLKKGSAAPGSTVDAFRRQLVSYSTHVQNVGWQKEVADGAVGGTIGRSLRLEGVRIELHQLLYAGSIEYRTHVQNKGWEDTWSRDGATSGTSGRSLRLEAIQIRLTGNMAEHYDVRYRGHVQNVGWMDWVENGQSAGTTGHSRRLEAIQIQLVPKDGTAAA